jgi:hypothetical protein
MQAKSLLEERTNSSVGERWLAVSGSRPSTGLGNGRKNPHFLSTFLSGWL